MNRSLRILGTRGIPAAHGGFETFAEHLAIYLAERDWDVYVYCQEDGRGEIYEDEWNGVKLVHIPIEKQGAMGTIFFDWKATRHASRHSDPCLTLGYNTAVFCTALRIRGIHNTINMDGIEWKRDKWSAIERAWLYANERVGCWLGNQLVADHPEIKNHLATRVRPEKITMIPYGSDRISDADESLIEPYGVAPGQYAIVVARPEPENSIHEIVSAFSRRERKKKLVVLGNFDNAAPDYRDMVFSAASEEVIFPGAIYEKPIVQALRFYACCYVHGHQVGGTNPSLVEALGAGSPIIAHDNRFNRWVAGPENLYFRDVAGCSDAFDKILENTDLNSEIRAHNSERHARCFDWEKILAEYEAALVADSD